MRDSATILEQINAMIETIANIPNPRPDTIIASPFFADTMKAEIDVMNAFAGRNWRRIKRERRRAHDAVKAKHKGKPKVAYFADTKSMTFNWSTPMRIDSWGY